MIDECEMRPSVPWILLNVRHANMQRRDGATRASHVHPSPAPNRTRTRHMAKRERETFPRRLVCLLCSLCPFVALGSGGRARVYYATHTSDELEKERDGAFKSYLHPSQPFTMNKEPQIKITAKPFLLRFSVNKAVRLPHVICFLILFFIAKQCAAVR